MITLMMMQLSLLLLLKIVLNMVLLSLPGDVPSDEEHYNAIPLKVFSSRRCTTIYDGGVAFTNPVLKPTLLTRATSSTQQRGCRQTRASTTLHLHPFRADSTIVLIMSKTIDEVCRSVRTFPSPQVL